MIPKNTRFRAYQLENAGSSFSYFDGKHFTLIEGRITDFNRNNIKSELEICNKKSIDVLHITSWDQDHCSPSQLEEIFEIYTPTKIEYPGYPPHTDCGEQSLKLIGKYKKLHTTIKATQISPKYIASLKTAKDYTGKDIIYHPRFLDNENANNNSTVKLFRTGHFNLLSLGDVESPNISSYLRDLKTIKNEVDIMILAHHGANNGFTTSNFIKKIRPKVAIATSNYNNQFTHPKQEIRDLLHKHKVQLLTTKTGDIIIETIQPDTSTFRVYNLISGGEKLSSVSQYKTKKSQFLYHNLDTLKDRYTHKKF